MEPQKISNQVLTSWSSKTSRKPFGDLDYTPILDKTKTTAKKEFVNLENHSNQHLRQLLAKEEKIESLGINSSTHEDNKKSMEKEDNFNANKFVFHITYEGKQTHRSNEENENNSNKESAITNTA